jgi:hypothetical protein
MYISPGERHATILDHGINLVGLLPQDYILGIGSSYSVGNDGLLILEQSPYLEDPRASRLSILGAIAGMSTYGDERKSVFALSNNFTLPSGIHVLLKERQLEDTDTPHRLPKGALEACVEISDFIRTTEGNLRGTDIQLDTGSSDAVSAKVFGVFLSDDMLEAYLKSIERGVIVQENEEPATGEIVGFMHHSILTPESDQLIVISMGDHRSAWYAEEAAMIWREERSRRFKSD